MNLGLPTVRRQEPSDLEEERLVRDLRRDATASFEQLYARHHRRIYGLAFRLTGRPSEAEELVQEVFVRAWDHRAGFRGALHFGRWLRRVAVNTWISQLRRREPASTLEDDADEIERRPAADGAPPGTRLDLEAAIAALPPRLRAVLLLFDLYGLRHEEIADQLEITVGASKVQLHRARRRLREVLS